MINKKGETADNVIMWVGAILAAFILFLWGAQNLYPASVEIDTIDFDIESLYFKISNACNSVAYSSKYNPRMEKGILNFTDDTICLMTDHFNRCRINLCTIDLYENNSGSYNKINEKLLDLETLTNVIVYKQRNGKYFVIWE